MFVCLFVHLFLLLIYSFVALMHRVAETERAESWELEKELEQLEHLELFFQHPKARSALLSSA